MHDRGLKRLLEDTSIFRNKCAIIAKRSDALSNESAYLVLIHDEVTGLTTTFHIQSWDHLRRMLRI